MNARAAKRASEAKARADARALEAKQRIYAAKAELATATKPMKAAI